ncbi:helix-turn-helix domain-containing protein [Streptomyces mirabilis]|uniref:helix-turn-helix domain-containing protein n=1 Tax=Streptomyces mirabilis TaxID=68239 RepID=UPI00367F40A1
MERTDAKAALAELKACLSDARASQRLTVTQLATRAHLSRTIASQALNGDYLPSADTVAALAHVLRLPLQDLLILQRRAAGEPGSSPAQGQEPVLGKPIAQWDPHDLEVHPAGPTPDERAHGARAMLPGYVRRDHDQVLNQVVSEAAQGRSRMLFLVGTSSTGKTRACWEAIQPLAGKGWLLWHPFDPTRAEAALENLDRVRPRTVVWLNEAQHYLGDAGAGERIAAAVHALCTDLGRAPVLVLGTLWPEYDRQYTALPTPGQPDPHSRVRELLAGRALAVPDCFDAAALRTASALVKAGDRLMADALTRAHTDGRVAQNLAGAPELLRRYENGTPAARALLEAAMDARRLGVGLHLPETFLTAAATDYLSDSDYAELDGDWAEVAYAEIARPVHGKLAPLRRASTRPTCETPGSPALATPEGSGEPVFRLADYLEQHGRTTRQVKCPAASFWRAAHTHLTRPGDLRSLVDAAHDRHRLQWEHHLRWRAAEAGDADALIRLAQFRQDTGDREGAEALHQRAVDLGITGALFSFAQFRQDTGDREGAEALYRRAVDAGDARALQQLMALRAEAGDWEDAEALARQTTVAGHTLAPLYWLMGLRTQAGDWEGAAAAAYQAVDAGDTDALKRLAEMRAEAGDWDDAEALAHRAADAGNTDALIALADMRKAAGDREGAEALCRRAVEADVTVALEWLAALREEAGDQEGAEAFAHQAAIAGHTDILKRLAERRAEAGDREGAEALCRRAVEAGVTVALNWLASMRLEAGDPEGAEVLFRWAANTGHTIALASLAAKRAAVGDQQGAERLFRRVVDAGHTYFLSYLVEMRADAGDWDEAEALAYRDVAVNDSVYAGPLRKLALMRQAAGDREGAEALCRRAVEAGVTVALNWLVEIRAKAGDWEGAEASAHQAADAGRRHALGLLAELRVAAGDQEGAEAFAQRGADAGRTDALLYLAKLRVAAGDLKGAEAIYQRALDAGDTMVLIYLAGLRGVAGDREGAEAFAHQAADAGHTNDLARLANNRSWITSNWPYGLDPNGTPSQPWDMNGAP